MTVIFSTGHHPDRSSFQTEKLNSTRAAILSTLKNVRGDLKSALNSMRKTRLKLHSWPRQQRSSISGPSWEQINFIKELSRSKKESISSAHQKNPKKPKSCLRDLKRRRFSETMSSMPIISLKSIQAKCFFQASSCLLKTENGSR